MNIEYYRNFIAIVEAGSISAAAKRVAVAQPALSNQLKTLQKKFGTPLLNLKRGGHTVELTEAGCILYNKANTSAPRKIILLKKLPTAQVVFRARCASACRRQCQFPSLKII